MIGNYINMKIPVFLPKSHLDRSYALAKQCVGRCNSLHGEIVLPWSIDTCIYFTSGRLQLK